MESHTSTDHRLPLLDALRGVAVLGMIMAHALFFFHDGSVPALVGTQRVLNLIVLTLFVFVAGRSASRTMDAHSHVPTRHLVGPVLVRASVLYMAYVITALVAIGTTKGFSPVQITGNILPALLLVSLPNFTEYLPLFILLSFMYLVMRDVFRFTRQSLSLTVFVGITSYALGIVMYPMTLPWMFDGIKNLLAGGTDLLRFPLLFYIPIFLLGLWWQHATDHASHARHVSQNKIMLIAISGLITIICILLSNSITIGALNPYTRWPPSIPYLTTGLMITYAVMAILPAVMRLHVWVGTVLSYLGRDALDLWVHHLILLFIYRYVGGTQFSSSLLVLPAIGILLIATIILASLTITNSVSFPLKFHTYGPRRYRKRYVISAIGLSILFVWIANQPISPYGGKMIESPLSSQVVIPSTAVAVLRVNRTWYAKHTKQTELILADLAVTNAPGGLPLPIHPASVSLYLGDKKIEAAGNADKNNTIHFSLFVRDLTPGTYTLRASVQNGSFLPVESNTAQLTVTEPLLVAWTIDWEGWDADPRFIPALTSIQQSYAPIPFTHFVHPRTFMDGVVTPQRKNEILEYLHHSITDGDEIALHLHMQFDFVKAAGIQPKYTNPWGLRTNEGYDIPTTEYTTAQFRQILQYALSQMQAHGFENIRGFRAGGWFIDTPLLGQLQSLNFHYDASGRSKPQSGAFITTPWNLSAGAQPYIVNEAGRLLEIPNNGLTTYESSVAQLIERIDEVYEGGILDTPTSLVYATHPQFYSREFEKIQPVVDRLRSFSLQNDTGPVVFVTMSEIADVWTSLHP